MSIRILTDSASDMVSGARSDVTVLPLRVRFGDEEFMDGVDISHREFYEKLVETEELPITSQATPYDYEKVYKEAAEAGDTLIVITLSSKLSGTYQSAVVAAADYENIYVVDSENVTVGEHALAELALRLKDSGMEAADIVSCLEREKKNIRLVALLDTLEYLKKGGRISKTAAVAGSLLSIKPVIAIENGEVVMLGKARGSRHGNNLLVEKIKESGGIDFEKPHILGYTGFSDALLRKYIADSAALWQGEVDSLEITTVGAVIGTHVGPGAIAVAFFCKDGKFQSAD
ncbi:MAG: DegV family protein [Butyrivibrio sp.]|nr:DegV family protein [Butyrivibrio sp.]